MKEALSYRKEHEAGDDIRCLLCPHGCLVLPGRYGACRGRKNEKGKFYSMVYGNMVSVNQDPIEKKPLYHFHPGSTILSVGTTGCNFRCRFCQNWEISQAAAGDVRSESMTPDGALALAVRYGSKGIAYTYNEPLINYEWVKETAALFREKGLPNVLVSNGFINEAPWRELLPLLDAANIDIKSFNENFYRELCSGHLAPVLKSVELMVEAGKHVEITTLLIPGMNDSIKELEALSGWLADLDKDIPLHFSRYFPQYRMSLAPTDSDSLLRAYAIARKKLNYVYLGNVPAGEYDHTKCPHCGTVLIERQGYQTKVVGLEGSSCKQCGHKTNIVQ
jgi:pyruvate formate lyase activating enzyme